MANVQCARLNGAILKTHECKEWTRIFSRNQECQKVKCVHRRCFSCLRLGEIGKIPDHLAGLAMFKTEVGGPEGENCLFHKKFGTDARREDYRQTDLMRGSHDSNYVASIQPIKGQRAVVKPMPYSPASKPDFKERFEPRPAVPPQDEFTQRGSLPDGRTESPAKKRGSKPGFRRSGKVKVTTFKKPRRAKAKSSWKLKFGTVMENLQPFIKDRGDRSKVVNFFTEFFTSSYSQLSLANFLKIAKKKFGFTDDQLDKILGRSWSKHLLGLLDLEPELQTLLDPFTPEKKWVAASVQKIPDEFRKEILTSLAQSNLDRKGSLVFIKQFLKEHRPPQEAKIKFPKWGIQAGKVLVGLSGFAKKKKLNLEQEENLRDAIKELFSFPLDFLKTGEAIAKLKNQFNIKDEDVELLLGKSPLLMNRFRGITLLIPEAREKVKELLASKEGIKKVLRVAFAPANIQLKAIERAEKAEWDLEKLKEAISILRRELKGKSSGRKLPLSKFAKKAKDEKLTSKELKRWAQFIAQEKAAIAEHMKGGFDPETIEEVENII